LPELEVTNWFGDLVSHPRVIVEAHSVDDIVAVFKDSSKYPSPIRAVGSNHSTERCGVADGGTLIKMKMNRILKITAESVTVEAGAIYIDIAEALEKQNLQLYVNTEIGNLTAGSAACAGTKDSSFPGEYGQVGSYVTGFKMVLPSGELLEVTDAQPELMRKMRSSHGLFGIVYEVTLRIRTMLPMAVRHETFSLEDFVGRLPELTARNEAMMLYIFPFDNKISVEFRKYNPGASDPPSRHGWKFRNYFWGKVGPKFAHDIERDISDPKVRYGIVDAFNATWRFNLEHIVSSDNTIAADQIIRYPPTSDDSRYTFSFFAFPEEQYGATLADYFKFSRDYYSQKGYRSNMLSVGYRVAKDQQALLSYSQDGNMITIDPVSTANPGWTQFLEAYNKFCSDRGGIPLLNQTPGLTREIARKAFGDRLDTLEATRRTYDPENRLLNGFFKDLLAEPGVRSSTAG